jgi:hypothetical protein
MVLGDFCVTKGISHGMETLGKHFNALAKVALQKHGFAQADLLSHWDVIAGDISAIAIPERIRWPRQVGGERIQGGTLVLKVNPGRALDVQYQIPQLIERLNQFLGYGAIGAIKVLQASQVVARPKPKPAPPPVPSSAVQEQVGNITDEPLKEALLKLGAQVTAARNPLLTNR